MATWEPNVNMYISPGSIARHRLEGTDAQGIQWRVRGCALAGTQRDTAGVSERERGALPLNHSPLLFSLVTRKRVVLHGVGAGIEGDADRTDI